MQVLQKSWVFIEFYTCMSHSLFFLLVMRILQTWFIARLRNLKEPIFLVVLLCLNFIKLNTFKSNSWDWRSQNVLGIHVTLLVIVACPEKKKFLQSLQCTGTCTCETILSSEATILLGLSEELQGLRQKMAVGWLWKRLINSIFKLQKVCTHIQTQSSVKESCNETFFSVTFDS